MGGARLHSMFEATRKEGRAALLPFMTAGLPDLASSLDIFAAMSDAGADGFEVGIPYADPLMDGPVIQKGSDTALAAGATIEASIGVLAVVARAKPVLAMTYANPVFRRGVDWFCEQLAAAGADGIIVPDLPLEESGPLRAAAQKHGIGLVQFVAPTSDEDRIAATAAADPVFIYAVAEMGVTGERSDGGSNVRGLIERIRRVTPTPVVLGVGISNPDQARAAADAGADGVIVGSALVRRILEADSPSAGSSAVSKLVSELASALRA